MQNDPITNKQYEMYTAQDKIHANTNGVLLVGLFQALNKTNPELAKAATTYCKNMLNANQNEMTEQILKNIETFEQALFGS